MVHSQPSGLTNPPLLQPERQSWTFTDEDISGVPYSARCGDNGLKVLSHKGADKVVLNLWGQDRNNSSGSPVYSVKLSI